MNATRILIHTGDAILPAGEAGVPVLDHGFLFGDSVYEVVRSANGRSFMLEEHLDRMRLSAAMIYFVLPWSDAEIERRLQEANLQEQIRQADLVIDATDNFTSRFAINAACYASATPLVSGAAIRMEGQVSVFLGQPGARAWRRTLSELGTQRDAGPEVLDLALAKVDPDRQAEGGKPPSKWLRSLHADEIRVWLNTIEVPEVGVRHYAA